MNSNERDLIRAYSAPYWQEYRVVNRGSTVSIFSNREAAQRFADRLNKRLGVNVCTVKP